MYMCWFSGVYAVVLMNVHGLVVRLYVVVLAAEGRQYAHELVVRCVYLLIPWCW